MKKRLTELLLNDNFISLTLSNPRKKSQRISKATVRYITNKNFGFSDENFQDDFFQIETFSNNQVFHENFPPSEIIDEIVALIEDYFKQVNVFSLENDIQILVNNPENPKFITRPPSKQKIDTSHDKNKNYIIPNGVPCDFLIHLGVMSRNGKVLKAQYSKFRQINRFLEIVKDAVLELDLDSFVDKPIRIIDFGCGKAYLTFAIYYMLHIKMGLFVDIIGLDLKSDVIKFCNDTAEALNYKNLKFEVGDIASYRDTNCNMVVTLHACDTATDYALINAVSWNSEIILSVPCCQQELFSQIQNDVLDPILKYGISKDKFTEILTNGLRGLKLEEHGYKVSMLEFTSLEHTAKNVVIRGIKKGHFTYSERKKVREIYDKIISEYHICPTIDKMQ